MVVFKESKRKLNEKGVTVSFDLFKRLMLKYEHNFTQYRRHITLSTDGATLIAMSVPLEWFSFDVGKVSFYFKNIVTATVYESKIASIRITNRSAKDFIDLEKLKKTDPELKSLLVETGDFDFIITLKNRSELRLSDRG